METKAQEEAGCAFWLPVFEEDEVDAETAHRIGVDRRKVVGRPVSVLIAIATQGITTTTSFYSVSFLDGRHFDNRPKTTEPCAICLMSFAGSTVFRHQSSGHGRNYGEQIAEKRASRPMGMIRGISTSHSSSITRKEFFEFLRGE